MNKCARVFCLGVLTARPAHAQELRYSAPIARLEWGTLGPEDPSNIVSTIGASFGWRFTHGSALIAEYLSQKADYDGDGHAPRAGALGKYLRRSWTLNYEWALSDAEIKHSEALLRVGGGALFRGPLPPDDIGTLRTAPVLSLGVTLRYSLLRSVAFVGSLEDQMAFLPHQNIYVQCLTPGNPSSCSITPVGGTEQNYGAFIGLELGLTR